MKQALLAVLILLQFGAISQDTITVGNTRLVTHTLIDSLTIPWDLHWGPDGWIWFNERDGNIYRLNPDTKEVMHVFSIPGVYQSWDNSGAHALALHPEFPLEPYIYAHYNVDVFESQLMRWTYSVSENLMTDPVLLMGKIGGNSSHNGSRIVFDDEGYLYLAMGDAFDAITAQDIDDHNGKILRMTQLGEVPDDNPYPGSYTWTYGHRNPQGLVFGRDGMLYSSEHGDATDDEINLIEKGKNYGWPLIEGFCDQPSEKAVCDSIDLEEPLTEWTPTYAPGGLAYFDHPSIPEWRHALLQTFLKEKRLTMLPLSDDGRSIMNAEVEDYFIQQFGRLRDVMVTPNGRVFICTSNEETNGQWVPKDSYDKIIEIRNPDYEYPVFDSGLVPKNVETKAFPNPTSDFVWLNIDSSEPTLIINVVNATGAVLMETEIKTIFPGLWQVDLRGLPDGVYSIIYETSAISGYSKVVLGK